VLGTTSFLRIFETFQNIFESATNFSSIAIGISVGVHDTRLMLSIMDLVVENIVFMKECIP
jgi:hypothetical protein